MRDLHRMGDDLFIDADRLNMGSTGSYVGDNKKPKEVVLEYQDSINPDGKEWKILKHTSRRGDGDDWSNIIYAAYQTPYGIIGLVICWKYYPSDREVVHKEISEDAGPFYCGCPNTILDMLDDTDNENALEWRKKCRENNAKPNLKKLEDGDKIRFKYQIGSLPEDAIFTVRKIGRKTRFDYAGSQYNIQGWTRTAYEFV